MKTWKFQVEFGIQDCYFHYVEAVGVKAAEYKIRKLVKEKYGEVALERTTFRIEATFHHLGAEYLTEYDRLDELFKQKERDLDNATDRKARLQLELDQLNEDIWDLKKEVETAENDRDNLQIKKAGEK